MGVVQVGSAHRDDIRRTTRPERNNQLNRFRGINVLRHDACAATQRNDRRSSTFCEAG